MTGLTLQQGILHAVKELVWLVITGIIAWLVLYPITTKIDFIYWRINAALIVIFITYFRYAITLKNLPFLRPAWVRFLLFTVNFSLFIYLMNNEQKLVALMDNYYVEDFGFPKVIIFESTKQKLLKYIYSEVVFFGTGSLITLVAFQLRLIISYWQYYKHKSDALLES